MPSPSPDNSSRRESQISPLPEVLETNRDGQEHQKEQTAAQHIASQELDMTIADRMPGTYHQPSVADECEDLYGGSGWGSWSSRV